jgi:Phasin protein
MPGTLYLRLSKEALGFTASCLQDQADYLKKLGECADPAEALKCQSDFVRQCWSRSREMPRLLDALRTNGSSAPPAA